MPFFEATTSIAVPAAQVWNVLLRTDRWPEWDPKLERVEGSLSENGRVEIYVAEVSRPFKLRVTVWEPNRRIVLTGGLPLGLFTGTRTYRLDTDGGRTRFTMDERYRGPLRSLIGRSIPDLQPSFDAFVCGVRDASEQ